MSGGRLDRTLCLDQRTGSARQLSWNESHQEWRLRVSKSRHLWTNITKWFHNIWADPSSPSSPKYFIVHPFSFQSNDNPSSVGGCVAIKAGSFTQCQNTRVRWQLAPSQSVQRAKSFRNLASLNVKILDNWWSLTLDDAARKYKMHSYHFPFTTKYWQVIDY